ncbi:MAG: glycosyltransferase [Acidobacteriota bacterium]
MKIAVLTPTIPEREVFLRECIEAVRRQTLKPYVHVITIDFGRVGPTRIRNGMAASTDADWLAFVDDDDLIDPEHLEVLARHSVGFDIIYSDCRVVGAEVPWKVRQFDLQAVRQANYVPITVLMRRELFLELGGFHLDRGPIGEDWDLWIRAGEAGARFRFVPQVTWTYRLHSGSRTLLSSSEQEFAGQTRSTSAEFEAQVADADAARKELMKTSTDGANQTDLDSPLPLILARETVIDNQRLGLSNGIEYWSRTYDGGDTIVKQTSLDLAEREAYFLSQLTGEYFPRVRDNKSEDGYSVIVIEGIYGVPLSEAVASINSRPASLLNFIYHCLSALAELKSKGIIHRNICFENIFVRDEKPILIDFAQAISERRPFTATEHLGGYGRPPDGGFCDVYSMGKVIERVNRHRHLSFDPVIELMTELDASLRITDLKTLRMLFTHAIQRPAKRKQKQ